MADVTPIRREEVLLKDLELRCEILEAAKEQVDLAVIRARQDGVGWQKIADAIKISRQAAMERFGKLPQLSGLH